MSARLAMKVLESGLSPALKPTALVMALFANDEGENIFPSVDRVAHLRGVSRRAVERDLSALRDLRVLVAIEGLQGRRFTGGPGRSVRYVLDDRELPPRSPYKPRRWCRGTETESPDVHVRVNGEKAPTLVTEAPTFTTQAPTYTSPSPDVHVTRSYIDLSLNVREQDLPTLTRRRARASETKEGKETKDPDPNQDAPALSDEQRSLYETFGRKALNEAIRNKRDDNPDLVLLAFLGFCARHDPRCPYRRDLAEAAIARAREARDRKAEEFQSSLRSTLLPMKARRT